MRTILLCLILLICTSCNKQKELAKIEIKNKNYDFGEISMSDSLTFVFSIKNISETSLKISKVGTSCGCTTTEYTKEPVKIGETATIDMLFKPNEIGYVEKSIVVESNTDPPFNVFYIKGIVVE